MSKQVSKRDHNSDESLDESKSSETNSVTSSSESSHHHKRSKKKRKVKKRKQETSSSEDDSDSSESSDAIPEKKRKKHKKMKSHKHKEVVEVQKRNEVLYVSSDEGKKYMKRNANSGDDDAPEKSENAKWGRPSDDDYRNKRRDWRHDSPSRRPNNYTGDNNRGRFDYDRQRNNYEDKKNRYEDREHNDGSYVNHKRFNNRDQDRRDGQRNFNNDDNRGRYNDDHRGRYNDDNRGRYNDDNRGRYNDDNRKKFNDRFLDFRKNDNRFKKPEHWKNKDTYNARYKANERSGTNDWNERPQRWDQHRKSRNDNGDYDRRSEREDNSDRRNNDEPWEDSQDRQQNYRDDERPKNMKIKSEKERRLDWGLPEDPKIKPEVEKEKPNFGLSGKLTEETNKVNGVVIKYAEPAEARKPKRRWRLYPFKGEQSLPTLYIHRQSCYLIGRDRKICDLPVDHPSCSKQHAVLQYRLVPFERENGTVGKRVRPYVIDLESANGTFINNKKIEGKKYIELLEKDVLKFGFSSREYVILHENSKDEEEDDDVAIE